jgi:hypothetical protein
MARDRKRAQLGLELPPELLERLRAHAAAERRTVTSLLRRWIEAGLAGALEPSAEPSAALVDLANRVDSLERDVAQLQVGALKVKRRSQARPPLLPAEVSEAADEGGIAPAPQALLELGELEIVGANQLPAEPASPDQVIPLLAVGNALCYLSRSASGRNTTFVCSLWRTRMGLALVIPAVLHGGPERVLRL